MDSFSSEISDRYRKRASAAERKIASSDNAMARSEWALIAVEWHLLANAATPKELMSMNELHD